MLAAVILASGCDGHHAPSAHRFSPETLPVVGAETPNYGVESEHLADGVIHRSLPTGPTTGIDLIDLDLAHSAAHIEIATENIGRTNGLIAGDAYLPREWLKRRHALAAVNGGYFGRDAGGGRKEFIGLLVQHGKVRRAAPPLYGHGGALTEKGHFARSAFGLTTNAVPSIVWAATDPADTHRLLAHSTPILTSASQTSAWAIDQAVGCGPTLLQRGRALPTDREERLVSTGPLPRTFVAYDLVRGHPRHFVVGIATWITYEDLGQFLIGYFKTYHRTKTVSAMCLDGGASTQFSYRYKTDIYSPLDTDVTVPDAILIVPNAKSMTP